MKNYMMLALLFFAISCSKTVSPTVNTEEIEKEIIAEKKIPAERGDQMDKLKDNSHKAEKKVMGVNKMAKKTMDTSKRPTREELIINDSRARMNNSKNYVGFVPELAGPNGVRVLSVDPWSPADSAGFQVGDLIRELNGKIVRSVNYISSTLDGQKEGMISEWLIRRGNDEMIMPIKTKANADYVAADKIKTVEIHSGEKVKPEPISIILSSGFSMQKQGGRFVVSAISKSGRASKAGLMKGDVITHLNEIKVIKKEDVIDKLNKVYVNAKYVLTIQRDGKEEKVELSF